MLDAFWAFLKNPAHRDAVGWIGGGIVVVASGLWAVIKFLSKKKNCWTWIELGDLWMVRGSLAEADKAFRSALKAAEDTDERDLAVAYNRVGNVLVAHGNLPEAFKSYRDSLAIRDGWPRLIRAMLAGSATSRSPIIRLETCWWRTATCPRRSNPTATVSRLLTGWPRLIRAMLAGSATSR